MSYVDAILHIESVPDLIAFFAAHAPDKLDADGTSITGFARTPVVMNGGAALVYVRVTPSDAAAFGLAPGVTILSQAPYIGDGTPDAVYTALFANPVALVSYDAVYSRAPYDADDGEGGVVNVTPPARFGQMG